MAKTQSSFKKMGEWVFVKKAACDAFENAIFINL